MSKTYRKDSKNDGWRKAKLNRFKKHQNHPFVRQSIDIHDDEHPNGPQFSQLQIEGDTNA